MRLRPLLLILVLCLLDFLRAHAATVVIVDSQERKESASLELTPRGAFHLSVHGKPIPLDGIRAIRFPSAESPTLRSIQLHRVLLVDGQVLHGEVLALDADQLTLKTAWTAKLCIPRGAVMMISPQPGWQPLFLDDFEGTLTHWEMDGKPELHAGEATSGKQSLLLDRRCGRATYRLQSPLQAGRIAVNVLMPEKPNPGRWFLELQLASDKGSVRLELLGSGTSFSASSPTGLEASSPVIRRAGWQRLAVEFTSERLLILADDRVIGFGKPLPAPVASCRFHCEGPPTGSLAIDDFAISKAVPKSLPLIPADPSQDDLFTSAGDEIFGKAVGIEQSSGVRFETGNRVRSVPWSETAGLSFLRSDLRSKTTEGEHVRILIRTNDGLRDELEVVVRKIDADHLVLMHAWLGEFSIPLGRVDEIRPLFYGQRLPIDGGIHHLGKNIQKGFVRPAPSGLSLMCDFPLAKALPGVLLLEAAHVVGPSDGPHIADALKLGSLRTEVYLNGEMLDNLNRQVDRSSDKARIFRLAVPADRLREGSNSLELRSTADKESGRQAEVEIYSLRLELPEARE